MRIGVVAERVWHDIRPMARHLTSLDDLADSLAKFPWWACVAAALVAFFALHLASLTPPPNPPAGDDVAVRSLWVTAAGISKWVVPIPLLIMAALSAWSRNRGIALHEAIAQDGGIAALRALSWDEVLPLLAEAFRAEGFAVVVVEAPEVNEAGVDLILTAGAGTWCVYARQWRAPSVGAEQVSALHGALAAHGATTGILVATGVFADEVVQQAEALNIELLGGEDLLRRVRRVRHPTAAGAASA